MEKSNSRLVNILMLSTGEERQNQNAKRQKIERENSSARSLREPLPPARSSPLAPVNAYNASQQHPLPSRPAVDPFVPGGPVRPSTSDGVKALSGSNADVVNNRAAIRMANMSAAESLKAELAAKIPLGRKPVPRINAERALSDSAPTSSSPVAPPSDQIDTPNESEVLPTPNDPATLALADPTANAAPAPLSLSPEHETPIVDSAPATELDAPVPDVINITAPNGEQSSEGEGDTMDTSSDSEQPIFPRGLKRKADDIDDAVEDTEADSVPFDDVDGDQADASAVTRKVNPDGTVEQEDTVR